MPRATHGAGGLRRPAGLIRHAGAAGTGAFGSLAREDGLVRGGPALGQVTGVLLVEVAQPAHCFLLGDTNDHDLLTLWRDAMPGGPSGAAEPPRHGGGNNFAFVDGHVQWLRYPGGAWIDGGPWVVPDMSMYSRTGRWFELRAPTAGGSAPA